jgi:hypothetical protein
MPRRKTRCWPWCSPRRRARPRRGSFAASRPPWRRSNSRSAGPGCALRRGSGLVAGEQGPGAPAGSPCSYRLAPSPSWPCWAGPPRRAPCPPCCRRWRTASSTRPLRPGRPQSMGWGRRITARDRTPRPAASRHRGPRPRRRARPARPRARRSPAAPRPRPKRKQPAARAGATGTPTARAAATRTATRTRTGAATATPPGTATGRRRATRSATSTARRPVCRPPR